VSSARARTNITKSLPTHFLRDVSLRDGVGVESGVRLRYSTEDCGRFCAPCAAQQYKELDLALVHSELCGLFGQLSLDMV
jgi:hypothetical protein